jgi:hypothetical protein
MQLNFNELNISDLTKYDLVNANNVNLVSSDAPVFGRAPELNIRLMSTYYELTWGGGDFKNASEYYIERAEGEKSYVDIYKTDADNSTDREYSYLSDRKDNSEVVYFRVKQINKDGSLTYSSQLARVKWRNLLLDKIIRIRLIRQHRFLLKCWKLQNFISLFIILKDRR